MACEGAFATVEQYNNFWKGWLNTNNPDLVVELQMHLSLAASDVHQALAAVGACECSFPAWAAQYLAKLNIVDAAIVYRPSCGPKLNDAQFETFQRWINQEYELIRAGKIVLCEGETSAEFPAFGTAAIAWTPQNAVQITANRILRTGM